MEICKHIQKGLIAWIWCKESTLPLQFSHLSLNCFLNKYHSLYTDLNVPWPSSEHCSQDKDENCFNRQTVFFFNNIRITMQEAAAKHPWNNSLTGDSWADLLALLSQGAQSVHDLLSLGSIYKASAEGWDAHTRHRVGQDLHRWTCTKKILLQTQLQILFSLRCQDFAFLLYPFTLSPCGLSINTCIHIN